MSLIIIDETLSMPPSEQIERHLRVFIAHGDLLPGDRLPTVRNLARDLGVAPNTVMRAYRELEQDNLVIGRGKRGTFVSEPARAAPSHDTGQPMQPDPRVATQLRAAAWTFAQVAAQLGIGSREALVAAEEAITKALSNGDFRGTV